MATAIVGILNKNCGQHLRGCLNSLLEQSFRDLMIVVVDGGSTDNSIEIIKEFMRRDKRIAYFVQKSTGTGMARNELIDYAKRFLPEAKVIVWGDAENTYDQNYLSNLLNVDADVVGGLSIIASESPLGQSLWWYYNGFRGETVVGNNEAIKIRIYEKYDYLPQSRTEDFFFHKRLLKNGVIAKKALKAVCYVKPIQSFSELVRWEKARTEGLWQGARLTNTSAFMWLTYFLTFSLSVGYFVLAPILLAFLNPILLAPYVLTLVASSLYLWLKGRAYVRKMKMETLFFFIPFFLLDSIIIFSRFLKLRFGRSRKSLI